MEYFIYLGNHHFSKFALCFVIPTSSVSFGHEDMTGCKRAALWKRSRPVTGIDIFLSHTWFLSCEKTLSTSRPFGSKELFKWPGILNSGCQF